jgi:hypothetical protein
VKKRGLNRTRASKASKVRRGLKWKAVLPAVFIVAVILALILYFHQPSHQSNHVRAPRAVIIDGLALTKPNPQFIEEAEDVLSKVGFDVDVYVGSNVTINLLMNIGGYELIVLRVHSAIDTKSGFLYLFSTERYNLTGYLYEQISGAVREAYTFNEREGPYFALRADLLGCSSRDGLNDSSIIMMGCNGTNSWRTIVRLFERGVKNIVAWDGYVDLTYSDKITLSLLKAVYEDKMDFPKAVEKTMDEYGVDPIWKSRLECLTQSD